MNLPLIFLRNPRKSESNRKDIYKEGEWVTLWPLSGAPHVNNQNCAAPGLLRQKCFGGLFWPDQRGLQKRLYILMSDQFYLGFVSFFLALPYHISLHHSSWVVPEIFFHPSPPSSFLLHITSTTNSHLGKLSWFGVKLSTRMQIYVRFIPAIFL